MTKDISTELYFPAKINLEDIAYILTEELDYDKITKFILEIDNIIADYDFTLELCKKFEKIIELENKQGE
jgi:hypothetical protein